jgi:hypothetical protein
MVCWIYHLLVPVTQVDPRQCTELPQYIIDVDFAYMTQPYAS